MLGADVDVCAQRPGYQREGRIAGGGTGVSRHGGQRAQVAVQQDGGGHLAAEFEAATGNPPDGCESCLWDHQASLLVFHRDAEPELGGAAEGDSAP